MVKNGVTYARVSPEHRMRIIKDRKRKRHAGAITGDRVNDAPALKRADIAVATGIKGTEVTKEIHGKAVLSI